MFGIVLALGSTSQLYETDDEIGVNGVHHELATVVYPRNTYVGSNDNTINQRTEIAKSECHNADDTYCHDSLPGLTHPGRAWGRSQDYHLEREKILKREKSRRYSDTTQITLRTLALVATVPTQQAPVGVFKVGRTY